MGIISVGADKTYVVNPDISSAHIHTIKTAFVTTTNRHVVRLSIGTRLDNEVKHGRIDKFDVVNGEVARLLDT